MPAQTQLLVLWIDQLVSLLVIGSGSSGKNIFINIYSKGRPRSKATIPYFRKVYVTECQPEASFTWIIGAQSWSTEKHSGYAYLTVRKLGCTLANGCFVLYPANEAAFTRNTMLTVAFCSHSVECHQNLSFQTQHCSSNTSGQLVTVSMGTLLWVKSGNT